MRPSPLDVGLPDILADGPACDPRTVGLSAEHRDVLAHLLRGGSCFVDAVAGTGKSALAHVYCDMRLSGARHPIRFFLLGPAFAPSGVPEFSAYPIGRHAELLADFDAHRSSAPADARAVLVVDEATLAGPAVGARLGDFHQVLLIGDTTQEVLEPGYLWTGFDRSDERIPTLSLGTSLRGLNETRFHAANFLAYSSFLDEVPLASAPHVDHLRFASSGPSPAEVAATAYLRGCRNVLMNARARCTVLLSAARGGDLVRDMLYLSPFKRPLFKVADPFAAQGLETDVAIVSTGDVDAAVGSPWEAYVFLRMVLGRSRSRMEVIVPRGASGDFTRVLALYACYDYAHPHPRLLGFAQLSSALDACGLDCRASPEGIVVFRPPSPDDPSDRGADLAVVAFVDAWSGDVQARRGLAAERGTVRVPRPRAMVQDGGFDPLDPWFAKFADSAPPASRAGP